MASSPIHLVDPAAPEVSGTPIQPAQTSKRVTSFDGWFIFGLLTAIGAVVAGIALAGVSLTYFIQPTAAFIVIGGTLGVTLITTPRSRLLHACRNLLGLWKTRTPNRTALIEEIIACARVRRKRGILSLKPMAERTGHPLLSQMLSLLLDAQDRSDLQAALETKMKLRERQGEADARVLEVMGGFAPTIGVLGTVVGLIDVLRQFSQPAAIAHGIGTAFLSTIYGLALANLILLPAAGRMRANTVDAFETEEMIAEGALGLLDGVHVTILRDRLMSYLPSTEAR